ncbi:HNH endonuclease signature motif containing protein [Mucilaginibacter sp. dw_454]|uniref:HNH endonuclease signature motif containing protein n=1 Tax=Mucilaginibacter sp. dw_454 TaxID=2720079 RepID=UPI001BD29968|nr:HNH endonuclease signature motif containing protein [Mucilaginibacter sp. dw_454]
MIIDTVNQKKGESFFIDVFYNEAIRQIRFDKADRASTVLKRKATGEESWKRNLRNCLQTLKTNGELVNSSPGFWRSPTPDIHFHLVPEDAWIKIKNAAEKALISNTLWASAIIGNDYKVSGVDADTIYVERQSTGSVAALSKETVIRGVNSLNAAGGVLGRGAMIKTVAKEAAIVFLHPDLDWHEHGKFIRVAGQRTVLKALVSALKEATDDDVEEAQYYARRMRKGQAQLRNNLLLVYDGKCCVSNTGPENVLQAAHIESHASKGNNNSTNALLLRSDLHDLFDDGLLLIEPSTLKIAIHPSLKDTDYILYDGDTLRERTDRQLPDREKLAERWTKYKW